MAFHFASERVASEQNTNYLDVLRCDYQLSTTNDVLGSSQPRIHSQENGNADEVGYSVTNTIFRNIKNM